MEKSSRAANLQRGTSDDSIKAGHHARSRRRYTRGDPRPGRGDVPRVDRHRRGNPVSTDRSQSRSAVGASSPGQAKQRESFTLTYSADSGDDNAKLTNVPAAVRDNAAGALPSGSDTG